MDRYFEEVTKLGALPTPASERADFTRYVVLRRRLALAADVSRRETLQREYNALGRKLAEGYVRFVIGKARDRVRARPGDTELLADLISAGNEGLLIARDRFDPAFGTHFLTYAAYWVSVKMDEYEHRRGVVHVSVHLRKQRARRDDIPPDPVLTPDDDVPLTDVRVDVARDALAARGAVAMRLLRDAGLSRLERFVLTLALGLRGPAHDDASIALVLYAQDRSLLPPARLRGVREHALGRLQAWIQAHPEATETLVEAI